MLMWMRDLMVNLTTYKIVSVAGRSISDMAGHVSTRTPVILIYQHAVPLQSIDRDAPSHRDCDMTGCVRSLNKIRGVP
jgi:hypothetical protein